jgi:hypothetical protein
MTSPPDTLAREAVLTLEIRDESGALVGEFFRRTNVKGAVTMNLLPVPFQDGKGAGVELVISNNSPLPQSASWEVALDGEQQVEEGKYGKISTPRASFDRKLKGTIKLDGEQTERILLPLNDLDPVAVYRMRAVVRDPFGRLLIQERPVGGFVGVPYVSGGMQADGVLDEAAWKSAAVQKIDRQAQFLALGARGHEEQGTWQGVDDLSGELRFLWDDQYLYVGVTVKDDMADQKQKPSKSWFQDGLQFLIDPSRATLPKAGKYDYAVALGVNGPQAWCYLSADAGAPHGEVKDMLLGIQAAKGKEGRADMVYEVAIPWSRMAPFQPVAGANLGLTMILNEGDQNQRNSFMTWFGNAHNKDIDKVGDLILLP